MTEAVPPMDGRVCLVTGASSGIGQETALALARMGATVVVAHRPRAHPSHAQYAVSRVGLPRRSRTVPALRHA